MATALPTAAEFTAADTTEGEFKAAHDDLRAYLAGLLGTDGEKATALASLGAALNAVLSKSADYTAVVADRGKLIDYTTAGVTLTLPAAASAGAGFVLGLRNSAASGMLTIGRNSANINGAAANITIAVGESCLIVCNGSGWKTVGLPTNTSRFVVFDLFNGSSYTPSPGVKAFFACVKGSTGGCIAGVSAGRGGVGGGGYSETLYSAPSGSYSYTFGAAGTTSGTAGGTTSFGAMSVTGSGGVTGSAGSAGGVGSGGGFNTTGGTGGNGTSTGGSGGGGAGASRSGNGYAGGNGASGGGGGGGGGGTGGVGGNAAATTPGVAGAAASSASGSAVAMPTEATRGYTEAILGAAFAGQAGNGVDGSGGGGGGDGATGYSRFLLADILGAPGGSGGSYPAFDAAFDGVPGTITILEVY